MISNERVTEWNRSLVNRKFRIQEDISSVPGGGASGEQAFRRGETVGIWLESSIDWIKVKAFPVSENREQAIGKTIIYLFLDDLDEDTQKSIGEDKNKGDSLVLEEIEKIMKPIDGQPLKIPEATGR